MRYITTINKTNANIFLKFIFSLKISIESIIATNIEDVYSIETSTNGPSLSAISHKKNHTYVSVPLNKPT